MTSDTRATDAVTPEPQAPMPSAETTGAAVVEATPSVEPQAVSDAEFTLPESASERTRKEFEKLQQKLAEERAKNSSVFDALRTTYQPAQATAPLYDQTTGYIDVNELDNLRKTALEAQNQVAQLRTDRQKDIEESQTREALSAYPELDPKSGKNHNKEFYKATRAILLDSMVNPQDYKDKSLTYKEAADIAKSLNSKAISEAEQAGATKAVEELTSKEQAALEATGRSDRRSQVTDNDLSERSRRNDYSAIMQRLKNIPPVSPR